MAEAALNVLSLTAPEANRTRTAVACSHCGLPCLTTAVSIGEKHFCCSGCQTVYEILTENGLGQFYELSANAGVTVKRPTRRERFLFLDEPAMRERLVDFTDGQTSRVTFQIPTIHCVACVWLLENLFQLRPGIGATKVNFPRREATIQFNNDQITPSELVALLASLGYEPSLSFGALEPKPVKNPALRQLLLRLGLAGFAFGNIMLISICLYSGLDSLSTAQFKPLFGWVSLALALPVVLFSASDYWRSAWIGLRQRILTLDQPIAVGIAAIFAWSAWEVATRTGHGYFDSLCGLIFFLLIGRWFQQKTYERLNFDRDYKSFFPLSVTRCRDDFAEETIPLSSIAVGDRLLIRHGELIPADARLIQGEGLMDYSFVTGEAQPIVRRIGETLYAGGQQMGGAVEVETVKPVSQSYLTSLWGHAAFTKPRDHSLDTILNRFTKRFTITVAIVAVGAAVWWALHGQPGTAVKAFTSVLIVACPCALALSAPFALGTAMRALARRNIFLKNTHVLEKMARTSTVVFDKTGTLTERATSGLNFLGATLTPAEQATVAALAAQSVHPLAQRVAQSLKIGPTSAALTDFREVAGQGVAGQVGDVRILLGSSAWLVANGIPIGVPVTPANGSAVHLALGGHYRGQFQINSTLRPDADKLITGLARHHDLALLSGDNEREREQFRQLFGDRANLHFNQSPLNKLGFIESLQRTGQNVMMVGDGLNDAGALRQSNVGVAVVENVGTFSPASDVILEARRVHELGGILDFSRGAVRIVWISIAISSLYNFIGLAIAASGQLSPVVCAVLMPISSISVVGFAVGATHWLARRTHLSPHNPNLTLNPFPPGPTDEGIKIMSKNEHQEVAA